MKVKENNGLNFKQMINKFLTSQCTGTLPALVPRFGQVRLGVKKTCKLTFAK